MLNHDILTTAGYKLHTPRDRKQDPIYQKRFRNENGDTLYFIDIKDHTQQWVRLDGLHPNPHN